MESYVDPYLEHMVRYTGAVVALVASFLAAPAATRHLWERGPKRLAITTAVQARAATAKVKQTLDMARGRRPATQLMGLSSAAVAITGTVTVTGTHVFPVDTEASLAERVERLERYIQTLSELHEANKQAITQEKASLVAMVRSVEQQVEQEAAAIHSRLDSTEQTAMLVDAWALPVIGLGIVLSSMSDLIARSMVLSNVLFAVALTVLAGACDHFFASRRAGTRDRSQA